MRRLRINLTSRITWRSILRQCAGAALGLTLMVFAALVGSQTAPPAEAAAKQRDKVVMRLSWFANGSFAPFFVAQKKGWYAEQGLDVEIRDGRGSGRAAKLVAAGDSTFGGVEAGTIVKSIVAGLPIKSVALPIEKSIIGWMYGLDLDIKSPKDLEGKTFGAIPGAGSTQLFAAFAKANSIDVSKVNIVNVDAASAWKLLAIKKVDFVGAVAGNEFRVKELGRPSGFFGLAEYGHENMAGYSLAAHVDTLREKPDMVRRFVMATLRGYEFSRDNPEEAINIFLAARPKTRGSREYHKQRLVSTRKFLGSPVGGQTDRLWQGTIDLQVEYSGLTDPPKVNDVYTNNFLPAHSR